MTENIKNIIFDLGGVLLNIDYNLTINSFKKLGMNNFDGLFTQAAQIKLFDRLDTGHLTPGEFRAQLRKLSGIELTDQQIDDAWNAMLLDMPPQRITMLENVRKHYRIFLLSNTNAIHYPVYNASLQQKFGFADLSALFEAQYLSYQVGMRKPDVRIFELVLRENKLNPDETLFIDDTLQHFEGAQKAGLHAFHLDVNSMDVLDLFNTEYHLQPELQSPNSNRI